MTARQKKLICLLPPAATLLIFAAARPIRLLAAHFSACTFHEITGFFCPGCGNTRAVLALLRFDLLTSLGYNILPPTAGLLAAAFYLELLLWAFGRPHQIVPRRPWFWWAFGSVLAVYFVARNFLPWLTLLW